MPSPTEDHVYSPLIRDLSNLLVDIDKRPVLNELHEILLDEVRHTTKRSLQMLAELKQEAEQGSDAPFS